MFVFLWWCFAFLLCEDACKERGSVEMVRIDFGIEQRCFPFMHAAVSEAPAMRQALGRYVT